MKRLALIILLALIAAPGWGALRYVDWATGSNAYDGSSWELAWETISKAASTVDAGDTTRIAPGNYGETVTIVDANTKWYGFTEAGRPAILGANTRAQAWSWNVQSVVISGFSCHSTTGSALQIAGTNGDGSLIEDVITESCGRGPNIGAGSTDVTIRGCIVRGITNVALNTDYGIALNVSNIGTYSSRLLVENCDFSVHTTLAHKYVVIKDSSATIRDSSFSTYSYIGADVYDFIQVASGSGGTNVTVTFERVLFNGVGRVNATGEGIITIEETSDLIADSVVWANCTQPIIRLEGSTTAIVRNCLSDKCAGMPVNVSSSQVSTFTNCAFANQRGMVDWTKATGATLNYCAVWNLDTDNYGAASVGELVTGNPAYCSAGAPMSGIRSTGSWWTYGTDNAAMQAAADYYGITWETTGKYANPIGPYAEAGCWTPTPTRTPSPPPSATPTASPTPSPTSTPTPSPTSTVTPSMAPTPTPAGTTPTKTPTPSVTPTPSTTPTPEHSPTPYVFPTAVPTRTPVGYQSPTPTPIPTPSGLPTPITTPTPIPKPSPTVTPSQLEFTAVLLDYIYSAEIGRWVYVLPPTWRYNAVISQ